MCSPEVERRLKLANQLVREAGSIILKYFQTDLFELQKKGDGSPLTIADQETEQFLRSGIEGLFPEDSIVGEEFDDKQGETEVRWILDPIDGTKSFISGVPLFGTMIGVEIAGKPTIGSVYFPALDEGVYASSGRGAWHFCRDETPVQAKVSTNSNMAEAVIVTSEAETFADRDAVDVWGALTDASYFARTWGDVFGYMLVATGRVDVMIDPELKIWDAAAVQPIIEEAGGRFTDWAGTPSIDAGEAIGSNGAIHEQVLQFTRSKAGYFA